MPIETKKSGSVTLEDTFHFLGILGLFTVFCWYAKTFMITFAISIMMVFILDPAVTWLVKHHVRRWMAVLTIISITVIIFLSISYLLVLGTQSFTQDIPKYRIRIEKVVKEVEVRMKRIEKATQDIIPQSQSEKPVSEIKIQEIPKWQEAFIYLLGILTNAALIPFLVFFILLDRDRLQENLAGLLGEKNRGLFLKAIHQIQSQMIGFLSGNFISIIILWFITFLGFLLAGVDYPVLNSGFFSICNVIPVIGPVIGLVPPLVVIILESDSWLRVTWVAGFGLGMHLIYANVLTPKLVGARVQIGPVAIILSMMYWGWIWGLTGLILAIPMVACLKTICDHVEPWKPIGKLLG